ncbi:hypothetical protein AABC73_29170 (plasmid) [Pseudomonas sp. G.S.17]|uniref:hypothetical protein n=1 Tax=Pseudomonas sp. G.S.17 TaxID=3137451 RepID=UPI00311CCF90
MDTKTRIFLAFGLIAAAVASSPAMAEFEMRDITNAMGQVKGVLGAGASLGKPGASYIAPGMAITLASGKTAKVYGSECKPREQPPCSSIKVDNSSHKVLIMPDDGSPPTEERWTFKKLEGDRLVARRPDGTFIEASR